MRNVTFALIAVAALLAAACSSGSDTPAIEDAAPSGTTTETAPAPSIADVVANAENSEDETPANGSAAGNSSNPSGGTKPGGEPVGAQRPTQLKLDTPERQRLVSAIETTDGLESYEFEWAMALPAIAEVGTLSLNGSGAMDPINERFAMTIDFTDMFAALANAEDATAEDLDLMKAFLGDDPMEMRYVDGIVYINWSLFALLLGADTPWIAFEDETGAGGFDALSGTGGAQITSPQDATAFLQDVWGVEEVGRETVRGVETTHYRGVIDMTVLGGLSPAEMNELESELGGASLGDVFGDFPVDIWIDDNDVMRRFVIEMDFSDFGTAGASAEAIVGSMMMSYEFFNIGGDINVTAPPATDVSEVSDSLFMDGFSLGS